MNRRVNWRMEARARATRASAAIFGTGKPDGRGAYAAATAVAALAGLCAAGLSTAAAHRPGTLESIATGTAALVIAGAGLAAMTAAQIRRMRDLGWPARTAMAAWLGFNALDALTAWHFPLASSPISIVGAAQTPLGLAVNAAMAAALLVTPGATD